MIRSWLTVSWPPVSTSVRPSRDGAKPIASSAAVPLAIANASRRLSCPSPEFTTSAAVVTIKVDAGAGNAAGARSARAEVAVGGTEMAAGAARAVTGQLGEQPLVMLAAGTTLFARRRIGRRQSRRAGDQRAQRQQAQPVPRI